MFREKRALGALVPQHARQVLAVVVGADRRGAALGDGARRMLPASGIPVSSAGACAARRTRFSRRRSSLPCRPVLRPRSGVAEWASRSDSLAGKCWAKAAGPCQSGKGAHSVDFRRCRWYDCPWGRRPSMGARHAQWQGGDMVVELGIREHDCEVLALFWSRLSGPGTVPSAAGPSGQPSDHPEWRQGEE